MNFYNENEEDKKGAPVVPSSASPFKKSAFGKQPMFSRAAGGIMDRLKNLSRKDMAFVGIGLSVLVMAPVAEYMMSSSPAQDNLLKETFNPRSGPGGVMDPGINGLSTGSPDGSGEVITPLSQRDPMSLILGAQPAAAAAMPPSAPPTNNFRDAMKESGRAAFSEAAKAAGAPTVIPRMQSALRGLSFSGDGGGTRTSGSLGGGKIIEEAQSASAKAKSRSMVGPVAMAGYKGVASNTPNSASKGAFEKLRSQADKSAGNFSGGSAMNSLDKAAADAANVSGSGGLGAGGDSEKTGRTNAYDNKYKHERSGDSLEETAAKARQAKALEWEFFKKYEFKKQLLTAVFGAVSSEVGKWVGGVVGGVLNPAAPGAPPNYCWKIGANGACYPALKMSDCTGSKDVKGLSCTDCEFSAPQSGPVPANAKCSNAGPASGGPGSGTGTGGSPTPGTAQQYAPPVANPPAVAKDFDGALKLLRADIQKAEDKANKPKDFLTGAKDVAAKLADLADGTQGYKFTLVLGYTGRQVADFQSARNQYSAKVSAANYGISQAEEQNTAQLARLDAALQPAALAALARSKGAALTQNSAIKADLTTGAADPQTATIKGDLERVKNAVTSNIKVAGSYKTQTAFLAKCSDFYDNQASGIGTATAGLIAKTKEVSLGSQEIKGKFDDFLTQLNQPAAVLPPEKLAEIGDAFNKLTGIPVKVGDAPATPAAKSGEKSHLQNLLGMRGADEDTYYKKSDIDDSKFMGDEGEKKSWAQISPKKKFGVDSYNAKIEDKALEETMKVSPVLDMRVSAELKDDLGFVNTTVDSLAKDIEALKSKTESDKAEVDRLLGTGAAVTPTPASPTIPVSSTTPAIPVNPANPATQGSNAAMAKADTVLRSFDPRISQAHVDYNEINANKAKCKTDICKQNFAVAGTQLGRMDNLKRDIVALREAAAKPGANVGDITRQIDDKQAALEDAHKQFSSAAAEVKRREGMGGNTGGGNHPPANNPGHVTPPVQQPPAKQEPAPREIHKVQLVKGRTTIPALNQQGKQLYADKCVKWGVGFMSGFTGQPVCKEYQKFPVMVEVNDYYLGYGNARGEDLPLTTTLGWSTSGSASIATADGTVYFKDASVKRNEYEMEVQVACRQSGREWVVSSAKLRKGTASSANNLGGKVSGGWDLGPKITAEISYSHTWNSYNHGEMLPFGAIVGKPCK